VLDAGAGAGEGAGAKLVAAVMDREGEVAAFEGSGFSAGAVDGKRLASPGCNDPGGGVIVDDRILSFDEKPGGICYGSCCRPLAW